MDDLYINSRLTIPGDRLSFTASRSSGPGGQNVNKVNSRITLRWEFETDETIPVGWKNRFRNQQRGHVNANGQVVLHSDGSRDQRKNLIEARQRLRRWLIETAQPPKRRKKTKPSRGSVRRRLDAKKQTGDKKRSRNKRWD